MSELKPCPFCGWGTIVDIGGLFSHSAGCNSCGTKTKNYKTWEEAVTTWNTRAETEAEKKIEHVRDECENILSWDKYRTDDEKATDWVASQNRVANSILKILEGKK